jgi:uncharacterized protein
MIYLSLALIILVGFLLGMFGGGGSILIIPILVYVLNIDILTAISYSFLIVGITSLLGAILKYKNKEADLTLAFIFSIPSITILYLIRQFVTPIIPNDISIFTLSMSSKSLIMILLALLMLITAKYMIIPRKQLHISDNNTNYFNFIIPSTFVGMISGITGAGAGFLITPILIKYAKVSAKVAIGSSLFVVFLNSFIGFISKLDFTLFNKPQDSINLILMTIASIIGLLGGSYFGKYLDESKTKLYYGYFIFILAIYLITKELNLKYI